MTRKHPIAINPEFYLYRETNGNRGKEPEKWYCSAQIRYSEDNPCGTLEGTSRQSSISYLAIDLFEMTQTGNVNCRFEVPKSERNGFIGADHFRVSEPLSEQEITELKNELIKLVNS